MTTASQATQVEPGPSAPNGAGRYFALDAAAVLAAMRSDAERGLGQEEAASRLAQHGPNEIAGEKPPSVGAVAVRQVREPMNIMLIAVTAVSFVIGEAPTAILVAALVLLNVVLGSRQELKARASVDAGVCSPAAKMRAMVWSFATTESSTRCAISMIATTKPILSQRRTAGFIGVSPTVSR